MESSEIKSIIRGLQESKLFGYINSGELPRLHSGISPIKNIFEKVFSTRSVKKLTSLTNRRLTDWDHRGALPVYRNNNARWRRYKPLDIFTLMICSEIREKFGTPVEKIKYIQDMILKKEPKCLEKLFLAVQIFNLPVYLITDFESVLLIKPFLEIADMIQKTKLDGKDYEKLIFLNISQITKKLFSEIGVPERTDYCDGSEAGYLVYLAERNFKSTQTPEEILFLMLALDKCRRLLDKEDSGINDEGVEKLRKEMYALVDVMLEAFPRYIEKPAEASQPSVKPKRRKVLPNEKR